MKVKLLIVDVDNEEDRTQIYKIYNRPRLPGVVIHFEYNSESANVIETLFKQIYKYI